MVTCGPARGRRWVCPGAPCPWPRPAWRLDSGRSGAAAHPASGPPRSGEAEAVFIVGVSRSGTTLTRRILDRHSRIGIATENHYLGHLLAWEGARHYFRRLGDLHDDATVRRLVDLIYSPEFQRRSRLRELSPYWRWLTERVPRADIEARLLASDRTERGIFEAFLRIYADRRGKAIMGEKTPAHLAYVETLLEWFPDARVVHCMRDPRAIYVSELRRRAEDPASVPYRQLVHAPALLAAFVLLQVTWAWATAVHRHRTLSRRFPGRYRLLSFEGLVASPGRDARQPLRLPGRGLRAAHARAARDLQGRARRRGRIRRGCRRPLARPHQRRARRTIETLLGRRLAEMGYR